MKDIYYAEYARALPLTWFQHAQWTEELSDSILRLKYHFFEEKDENRETVPLLDVHSASFLHVSVDYEGSDSCVFTQQSLESGMI